MITAVSEATAKGRNKPFQVGCAGAGQPRRMHLGAIAGLSVPPPPRRSEAHEVVARRKHNAPLLEGADAGTRAAVRAAPRAGAPPRTPACRRVAQDQVDLAAAAPRRPIIARHQPQARGLQVRQRAVFAASPRCLVVGRVAGPVLPREFPLIASFASALVAARDAAAQQHYPQGALYVVATPIGNLADITPARAARAAAGRRGGLRGHAPHAIAAARLRHRAHRRAAAGRAPAQRAPRPRRRWCSACAGPAHSPTPATPARPPSATPARGWWPPCARRACVWCRCPAPAASPALSAAGSVARTGGFVFAGFLPGKAGERDAQCRLAGEPRAVVLLEAPAPHGGAGRARWPCWAAAPGDRGARADQAV
jgi:hypothetical protein